MVYSLTEFCTEATAILTSGRDQAAALDEIAARLRRLIAEPGFAAETFSEDTPPGHRVLHHCPITDYYLQAHVQRAGKSGLPHSHGASWAIYGNVTAFTDMTEWRRINPDSEDFATVEPVARYRVATGETKAYGPHLIHSTSHPETAWVIRMTGCDLDTIPRFKFHPKRDRMAEPA